MIVIEGPDNAGKTTLAKELMQLNSRLEYFHAGSAPKDLIHEQMCIDQQFEQFVLPHVIGDRATCISQQVYQEGRLFEHKLLGDIDRLVMIGCIIVYCRPSTDRLMAVQSFQWRDEETEAHKQKIIRNQHTFILRYDELMTRVPHIAYNFEEEMASAWIRKMLSEAPMSTHTYHQLREVMINDTARSFKN